MEKIFFTKMNGAGNDFVFIDKNLNPDFILTPEKIKKLCNRRFGVGADGVIAVSDDDDFDFKMSYYNADGSTGSLCANGARCSIWFAENTKRLKNQKAKFTSANNEYTGEVISEELIRFDLNEPSRKRINFMLNARNQFIKASFIDTGSPHVVINISDILKNPAIQGNYFTDILEVPVYDLGKEIRYHKEFAPEGTNVNFVNVVEDQILIRTYERGVEDETLACGTGSVASAIICCETHKLTPPVTLLTYGGDKLFVNFQIENQKIINPSITGPAKIVFEGTMNRNFFI